MHNGLAAYQVNQVVQDEQGYIWLATIAGLQRFDGTKFLTFRSNKKDKYSIPDNQVNQILIDKRKNLWLATSDGSVGIFDTKRMIFKPAVLKAKDPKTLLGQRSLSLDSSGNLIYTLVFNEILIYDYNRNEFNNEGKLFKSPPGWKVMRIIHQ